MSRAAVYRGVVALLWLLATYNTFACRGLFWDGSSFLVNVLDLGSFHDFYAARAHVDWLTQAPVLVLSHLGVRDTRLLAIVYSATLFALPTAFYHLALARVRHDLVALGIMVAVVATVYLPTWFFIIGEYNVAFAAVAAAVAIALTPGGRRLSDAVLLLLLGLLCLRSYEAMVYLGPLVAAIIVWSARRRPDVMATLLAAIAALAFVAAAVISASTIIDYWDHPHFAKVRTTSLDFWQNLQFATPLAGLAICVVMAVRSPEWLKGRGPLIVIGVTAVALALSPWWRLVHVYSILYPPAHYLARQAAGLILAVLLVCLWLHVGWLRAPPQVLAALRQPTVARRMVGAMVALLLAGAVPDLALTGLWSSFLDRVGGLVDSRSGIIPAGELPLVEWPNKLFVQDWSLPALSALRSRSPGRAFILVDKDYRSNPPFDPACGTLPRLSGYHWGGSG